MSVDRATDFLLDILGNETRRKMLQLLADEPRYLLQLAEQLNVSQQAVLKHLVLLEKMGFVTSFKAESDLAAPPRKYYQLARSFYLSVSMTRDTFGLKIEEVPLEQRATSQRLPDKYKSLHTQILDLEASKDAREILEKCDRVLHEIGREAEELKNMEIHLLKLRHRAMKKAHEAIQQTAESALERRILYHTLGSDVHLDVDALSEAFDIREREIEKAIASLRRRMRIPFFG